MSVDKVSFKSRIIFVDYKTFEKIPKSNFINWNPNSEYMKVADEFYTNSVRTCTAGALINTKTGKALGFHIYDCLDNYLNLDSIINAMLDRINPDKCLLFGGKKYWHDPFSMPIFRRSKNMLGKNIEDMTIFEKHLHLHSETAMCYSANDDTFYILSRYTGKDNENHAILTENELRNCFKKIKIAPGDELIFLQNVS